MLRELWTTHSALELGGPQLTYLGPQLYANCTRKRATVAGKLDKEMLKWMKCRACSSKILGMSSYSHETRALHADIHDWQDDRSQHEPRDH